MMPQPKETRKQKKKHDEVNAHGVYKSPQFVLPEHAFNTSSSPCSYIHFFMSCSVKTATIKQTAGSRFTIKHQIKKQIIRLRVVILCNFWVNKSNNPKVAFQGIVATKNIILHKQRR